MSPVLDRVAPLSLIAGGLANVLFLVASGGQVVGAHVVTTTQWTIAHHAHFYAAMFLLLGALGIRDRLTAPRTAFDLVASFVTVVGTALFLANGAVTAYVIPVIARSAPAMLEASGPLFNPPLQIVSIAHITFAIGWLLTAMSLSSRDAFPRWATGALAIGTLLASLPPAPFGAFPWILIEVGGVIMAIGLAAIGVLSIRPRHVA